MTDQNVPSPEGGESQNPNTPPTGGVPPQQPPAGAPQGGQIPPQQPGYPQQGGPQGGYQQQPPAEAAPLSQAEDKQWAMFSHFGGVIGLLPALIIFLVFNKRGPWTKQESKEALNWQITFTGSMIILAILSSVITSIMLTSLSFGALALVSGLFGFLMFALWAVNVIFSIMGGMKVNNNGAYRYPFAVRFIK